jgi:hypothetical protein
VRPTATAHASQRGLILFTATAVRKVTSEATIKREGRAIVQRCASPLWRRAALTTKPSSHHAHEAFMRARALTMWPGGGEWRPVRRDAVQGLAMQERAGQAEVQASELPFRSSSAMASIVAMSRGVVRAHERGFLWLFYMRLSAQNGFCASCVSGTPLSRLLSRLRLHPAHCVDWVWTCCTVRRCCIPLRLPLVPRRSDNLLIVVVFMDRGDPFPSSRIPD